jgi:hypothetical protein
MGTKQKRAYAANYAAPPAVLILEVGEAGDGDVFPPGRLVMGITAG